MYYPFAFHMASGTRCQLLTLSTLAGAFLLETRGLVDDLSMVGGRASVAVQMTTMTLDERRQPGLDDQWPTRSVIEPLATEPDPSPVIADNRDRGSMAQTDDIPLHEWRRPTDHGSPALLPIAKRRVRSRS